MSELPATLTEAQLKSGVIYVQPEQNVISSSFRSIPYAERYRSSNAVMETPIEHLQRAAHDEARRKLKGRQAK